MRNFSIIFLSAVSASSLAACGDSPGGSATPPSVETPQSEITTPSDMAAQNAIIKAAYPQPDDENAFRGNALFVGQAAPASDGSNMSRIADRDSDDFGTYDAATVDLTTGNYTLNMWVGVSPDRAEDTLVRLRYNGESEKRRRTDVVLGSNGSILRTRGDVTSASLGELDGNGYRAFTALFTVPAEYEGSYTLAIFPAVGRAGQLTKDANGGIAVGGITLTRSN